MNSLVHTIYVELQSNTTNLFCRWTFFMFGYLKFFQLAPMTLQHIPVNIIVNFFCLLFWAFSYFLTLISSWIILLISCPTIGINHFSKNSWFLLLESDTNKQDLGIRCAHCLWVVAAFSLLSWQSKEMYILSSV
jgi:hypothetical protein